MKYDLIHFKFKYKNKAILRKKKTHNYLYKKNIFIESLHITKKPITAITTSSVIVKIS